MKERLDSINIYAILFFYGGVIDLLGHFWIKLEYVKYRFARPDFL